MNWSRSRAAVGALTLGVMALGTPALAATHIVNPGDSIQDAIDAAAANDTVLVMPGDYTGTAGAFSAVHITKSLKLYAKSKPGFPVRILPGLNNKHGILVEPANPGVDPDVTGVKIKGFTIEGFPKNGIWLRYVDGYKIEDNTSINNLENGIWPTLSANGLVKKNVAYGSEDAALWVEASDNVRVLKNELSTSPTGLEVTISSNLKIVKNEVHDNTVGVGLYHPSAAGLPAIPPYTQYGNWQLIANHIYSNNNPNNAPPGSMSAALPAGCGVLLLGVDNVTMKKNLIEDNDSVGIGMIDWCVGAGTCVSSPPVVTDTTPDNNTFIANTVINNGSAPSAAYPLPGSDTLFFGGTGNCVKANTIGNTGIAGLPATCS